MLSKRVNSRWAWLTESRAFRILEKLEFMWSAWERLPALAKTALNAVWWFLVYIVLPRRTMLLTFLRFDSIALSVSLLLATWAIIEIIRYHRAISRTKFIKDLAGALNPTGDVEKVKIAAGQTTITEPVPSRPRVWKPSAQ